MAAAKSGGQKTKKKVPEMSSKDKLDLEILVSAREQIVRFFGLANAGGIVATITTLGATAKPDCILNILALPMALFSAGVICALLHAMQGYISAVKRIGNFNEGRPLYVIKFVSVMDEFRASFVLGMLVFFVLGCLTGILIIAFA